MTNNNQRLKSAEWQGYVRAKLEGIEDDVKELKKHHNKLDERFQRLDKKVAKQSGVIAIIVSAFVSAASFFFRKFIGG